MAEKLKIHLENWSAYRNNHKVSSNVWAGVTHINQRFEMKIVWNNKFAVEIYSLLAHFCRAESHSAQKFLLSFWCWDHPRILSTPQSPILTFMRKTLNFWFENVNGFWFSTISHSSDLVNFTQPLCVLYPVKWYAKMINRVWLVHIIALVFL